MRHRDFCGCVPVECFGSDLVAPVAIMTATREVTPLLGFCFCSGKLVLSGVVLLVLLDGFSGYFAHDHSVNYLYDDICGISFGRFN